MKSKTLVKALTKVNAEDPEGLAREILQQRDEVEGPEPQHVGLGEGDAPWLTTGEAAEELRCVKNTFKNGCRFLIRCMEIIVCQDRLARVDVKETEQKGRFPQAFLRKMRGRDGGVAGSRWRWRRRRLGTSAAAETRR